MRWWQSQTANHLGSVWLETMQLMQELSGCAFRKRINSIYCKSMVPEAGIEPARLAAGDFESPASTNFTTRADCEDSDYDMFLAGFGGLQMIFIVCTTCCQHLKIRAPFNDLNAPLESLRLTLYAGPVTS